LTTRAAGRGEAWKAFLALLVVDLLGIWLTDTLTLEGHVLTALGPGPDRTRAALAVAVSGAGLLAWALRRGRAASSILAAYLVADTAELYFALAVLVADLPSFRSLSGGFLLLGDAVLVWLMNVILFGIWYWLVDGGGPSRRGRDPAAPADFAFVQHSARHPGWSGWQPGLVDYLFLSFNASTTFGPTDTLVLSRRAKILMMVQVVTSLASFAVLAARAVSILS
jgi:hypothetical protein